MQIFNSNYDVVRKDLLNAIDTIHKSNDIDEIIAGYIGITDFYEDMQIHRELRDVLRKLKRSDKYSLAQSSIEIYYLKTFKEEIRTRSDYYYKIFQKQSEFIDRTIGDIDTYDYFTPLNDDDIYGIISDYLSKNDPRLLELFNTYIENNVILSEVNFPFYLGLTSVSPAFKNIYIKTVRKNNFKDMLVIVHEMAHARVFEDIINVQNHKEFNKFVCTNLYIEVYPRLYERYFLQYLLDNNIFVDDVKKYLGNSLLFFNKLLLKSIKQYDKEKQVNDYDIKDISSFLYRDLLFLNGISISDRRSIRNTIDEKFYLSNFSQNDISSAITESTEQIKKLVK